VISMMNTACDVKRMEADNIVSICMVMSKFLKMLEKKHEIDHEDVVKLYSSNH
jgi:hypothetical protein